MGPTHKSSEKKNQLKGRYANILRVGYNAYEFVFDFGQAFSESESAKGCTRIVTSPGHAKAMIMALQTALEAFEHDFGRIGNGCESENGSGKSIKNNR